MRTEGISPLRRRMIEDMTVRNMSSTTREVYIHNVKKFSQYFGRSPDCLGLEDVRTYQVHLVSKGIAWATLNQVVSALRFFLWRDPGTQGPPGTHRLCAPNQDAACDLEPGGGCCVS